MGKRIPIVVNGRREILWNEVEQPTEEQNSAADHFQNPTPDLPTESIMSIPQNQPTSEEEQHRTAERKYWRRQNWITGIAAAVGLAGLVGLYCTLKITRETMIHAERAWIVYYGVGNPSATEENKNAIPLVDGQWHFILQFINAGKGPASEVSVSAIDAVGNRTDAVQCKTGEKPAGLSPSKAVMPGGNEGNPLLVPIAITVTPEKERAVVKEGDKRLFIYGIVEYQDQFSIERTTEFCIFFDPTVDGVHFQYCPCGNVPH